MLHRPASRGRVVLLVVTGQTLVHGVLTALSGHVGDEPVTGNGPLWLHHLSEDLTADHAAMAVGHALAAAAVGLWLAVGETALWAVLRRAPRLLPPERRPCSSYAEACRHRAGRCGSCSTEVSPHRSTTRAAAAWPDRCGPLPRQKEPCEEPSSRWQRSCSRSSPCRPARAPRAAVAAARPRSTSPSRAARSPPTVIGSRPR